MNVRLREKVEKEIERVKFALKEIKVKKGGEDLFHLAKSYFKDALYFYERKEYLKAFELLSYVFGLLDGGARLKYFDPGKARKHFKIEQDV